MRRAIYRRRKPNKSYRGQQRAGNPPALFFPCPVRRRGRPSGLWPSGSGPAARERLRSEFPDRFFYCLRGRKNVQGRKEGRDRNRPESLTEMTGQGKNRLPENVMPYYLYVSLLYET